LRNLTYPPKKTAVETVPNSEKKTSKETKSELNEESQSKLWGGEDTLTLSVKVTEVRQPLEKTRGTVGLVPEKRPGGR